MPSLLDLQRALPPPPPPDANRLTRLRAATRFMDDLQRFFTQLQSTTWFAIGIILGQDPEATEAEKVEAIERLARQLERRWRVSDRQVRDEVLRRAKEQGTTWREIKLNVLRPAIWYTFLGDLNEPQTVCYSPEGYVVDDAGHRVVVAPGTLPSPYVDRWAYTHAIKVAEALLLDVPPERYEQFKVERDRYGDPISLQSSRDDEVSADSDAAPAYLLLEREEQADTAAE